MIALLIITHGHFGQELLRTAQDIVGRQDAIASLSVTSETAPDGLSKAMDQVIESFRAMAGILILVDMMGGTPSNISLLKSKTAPIEIVTGANLYMVISAFSHRESMELKPLAEKVAEDGRRAILLPKDMLLKKLS